MVKYMAEDDTLRFTFYGAREGMVESIVMQADWPSDVRVLKLGDTVPMRVTEINYKGRTER